jgi:hypothetical protein
MLPTCMRGSETCTVRRVLHETHEIIVTPIKSTRAVYSQNIQRNTEAKKVKNHILPPIYWGVNLVALAKALLTPAWKEVHGSTHMVKKPELDWGR